MSVVTPINDWKIPVNPVGGDKAHIMPAALLPCSHMREITGPEKDESTELS